MNHEGRLKWLVLLQANTWTRLWCTDELDNDTVSISGLVHAPSMPGLPGGNGHAGYLVSAAGQLLNLYECSASGGRGEASLQVQCQCMPCHNVSFLRKNAAVQGAGRFIQRGIWLLQPGDTVAGELPPSLNLPA